MRRRQVWRADHITDIEVGDNEGTRHHIGFSCVAFDIPQYCSDDSSVDSHVMLPQHCSWFRDGAWTSGRGGEARIPNPPFHKLVSYCALVELCAIIIVCSWPKSKGSCTIEELWRSWECRRHRQQSWQYDRENVLKVICIEASRRYVH